MSDSQELITTTYSFWKAFKNCRRKCDWRYNKSLVPVDENENLYFGSLAHKCLELWYLGYNTEDIQKHIDEAYMHRDSNAEQLRDWNYVTAMMNAYYQRYKTEPFEFAFLDPMAGPAIEHKFNTSIINPDTGRASKTYQLKGKVDGVIILGEGVVINEQEVKPGYYLLEHKTASSVDECYWEQRWTDFQITLYSKCIERVHNIKIEGVLYNVLLKPKLRQKKAESDEEFEARKKSFIARSKTGKTKAKKHEGESNESFQERLAEWYEKLEAFQRKIITIPENQYKELEYELWELTQAALEAKKRDGWYRNPDFCFNYNRACEYYDICRPGANSERIIEARFKTLEPHVELKD